MFEKVSADAEFVGGEHQVLKFWESAGIFDKLRAKNAGKPPWSFLDGPITANNPMGVHHAWGRTYKDAYQRFFAMNGHELRYQNGFDCQGLWVEIEVERDLGFTTKASIETMGIDTFSNACKQRVLKFAARQTEQSIRLGYWMDWDSPEELRKLSENVGKDEPVTITTPSGKTATGPAHQLVGRLGCPEWGGSYFTFSTENNETIWTFLKKCFERGKIKKGHDVMPWSGRAGSAYSQMEVADGRKLSVHKSVFVRFPLRDRTDEYLLVWTTTPWTLTSNVAAAVNPELEYVKLKSKRDGAVYYFAKENLDFQRLSREFKEGFGRPEWEWPKDVPKLKSLGQIFKEQGGFEIEATILGAEMVGWEYDGPFDDLAAQQQSGGVPERVFPEPDFLNHYDLSSLEAFWDRLLDGASESALEIHNKTLSDGASKLGENNETNRSIVKFFLSLLHLVRAARDYEYFDFSDGGLQGPDDWTLILKTLGVINADDEIWQNLCQLYHDGNIETRTELAVSVHDGLSNLWRSITDRVLSIPTNPATRCHRVIDGGRDSKGKPNVVAGEGTGIVHIAPGCGDIDHKLGAEQGIVGIAPLEEDGTFTSEFGDFAGRRANDPETAELVFEKLKAKHLLVAVESYPHIYPHCWRTGDELVFRLVDEWFIDMDWRDEIKAVTEQIRWLPDAIDGKEREIEWLTNMRDWMISKKRFWGLALPIWVDEETGDFEVIGSLAELKERAVEGWDEFEGHTPHRPWIDKVKIANPKNGNVMSRIPDVGNPWLDAGIVPFSTMHYNSNREEWQKWYPADFVTECFPGQFRNWFYALLAMGTMMDNTPPFKTLLGHRLVMNEEGKPMHKSDGTAIWFEEAAEQVGVDTMRWMFLGQNPATDLRFGHRNPDKPVTLQTPNGPVDQTAEGVPTCAVVSGPADETRRQILITLWNTYTFFVNYARLDEFDATAAPVPVAERPEIDRWVLANLHALVQTANTEMQDFNVAGFLKEAARFIDDLSNWYIRRNRRRFWRSKDAGDRDKLAAYQTLYDVLVTLTKLLAPVIPFLSERLYQNLVCAVDKSAPESVHLCDYPQADSAVLDPELSERMALAQLVVNLGHGLREKTSLRVRQPLAELRFACANPAHLSAIENLSDVIKEELNIKQITGCENLDELVSYTYKPNLKTLGPRYGKLLGVIRKELPNLDGHLLAPLRSGESVTVTLGGEELELGPDDVMVGTEQAADWAAADQDGVQIALSTVLTPELIGEGMARDVVRHVQQLRKDADLDIENRIVVTYCTDDAEVVAAIEQWQGYICGETLADALSRTETPPGGAKSVSVGPADVALAIAKV